MKTREALTVLAEHRGDAIVVCALGMAANEWWAVTKSEDSFYMHGGMGFAASFALGLATALPHAPVWVLNSDGSLSMNLGCLLTEAGQQPANLKHFVVDNQSYQTVDTMPMVNQDNADYAAIARGAGIRQADDHRQSRRPRKQDCPVSSPRRARISSACASSPSPTTSARRPRPMKARR